mmetsp:Transcript_30285/g.74439  ORF Transcript_30285/g.74439 Transcript_30285/m.74439 type:complete len:349 (+) Transcript_30285:379-1425(+)
MCWENPRNILQFWRLEQLVQLVLFVGVSGQIKVPLSRYDQAKPPPRAVRSVILLHYYRDNGLLEVVSVRSLAPAVGTLLILECHKHKHHSRMPNSISHSLQRVPRHAAFQYVHPYCVAFSLQQGTQLFRLLLHVPVVADHDPLVPIIIIFVHLLIQAVLQVRLVNLRRQVLRELPKRPPRVARAFKLAWGIDLRYTLERVQGVVREVGQVVLLLRMVNHRGNLTLAQGVKCQLLKGQQSPLKILCALSLPPRCEDPQERHHNPTLYHGLLVQVRHRQLIQRVKHHRNHPNNPPIHLLGPQSRFHRAIQTLDHCLEHFWLGYDPCGLASACYVGKRHRCTRQQHIVLVA